MTRARIIPGRRAVAVVTALSAGPRSGSAGRRGTGARSRRRVRRPGPGPPAKYRLPCRRQAAGRRRAGAAARRRARAGPVDGGWPRAYTTPSGGEDPGLSAAGRELGPTRSTWSPMRPCPTRPRAPTKPALGSRQDRGRHQGGASRERLVNFSHAQDHRGQLPDAAEGAGAGGRRRDRQGDPGRRARDRARPRAGERRHEPDHPEERRGREGRSAGDLLQQDAGRPGEPRRRADLEPDQGQRPEVRRQHQLGPVPARADEDATTCATSRAG